MKSEIHRILRNILSDIRVELSDEFDKNFEREAFFSEAWQRRKSPARGSGHLLVDTGGLRQSIQSKSDDQSITFFSTAPQAAIHNDGGEIKVTPKMKRFFWAKYYEATGGFQRTRSKMAFPARSISSRPGVPSAMVRASLSRMVRTERISCMPFSPAFPYRIHGLAPFEKRIRRFCLTFS